MSFGYQSVPNSMPPLSIHAVQSLGMGPPMVPQIGAGNYLNPMMAIGGAVSHLNRHQQPCMQPQTTVAGLNDAPLEFKTNITADKQNISTVDASLTTSGAEYVNSSPLKLPISNSTTKVEKIVADSTSSSLKSNPAPIAQPNRYHMTSAASVPQPNLMENLIGMNYPFVGMNMFGIEPSNLFGVNNFGYGLPTAGTAPLPILPSHVVERDVHKSVVPVVATTNNQETICLKSCTLIIPTMKSPSTSSREKPLGCKTIFVKGLPEKMTEDILMEIFERCGEIQSLRFFKRSFCHVRFASESAIDAAILLTGYKVRIGQSTDSVCNGRLYIDYAQTREDKYDYECKQRQQQRELRHREKLEEKYLRAPSPNSIVPYTDHEASIISDKVKHDSSFLKAVQVIIRWLECGDCSKKNVNLFYSMIQSTNSHVRRLLNEKVQFEEEFQKSKNLLRSRVQAIYTQFNQVEKVFSAASHKKVWDHFSKAQRKNIDIWKKQCSELKTTQTDDIFGSDHNKDDEDESDEEDKKDEQMSISDDSSDNITVSNKKGDSRSRKRAKEDAEDDDVTVSLTRDKKRLKCENKNLQSQLNLARLELETTRYQLQNSSDHVRNSTDCDIQLVRRDSEAKILCLLAILLNVYPNGLEMRHLQAYLKSCQLTLPNFEIIEVVLNKFSNLFEQINQKWRFVGLHSKAKKELAFSSNNNEIQIYKRGSSSDWKLDQVLKEHEMRVTSIDWAPQTNRIVTCSADRNGYVWSLNESGQWIPNLVLLRINRAATCVKWSPNEQKFAVGAGDKVISVCHYDSIHNWWLAKHIKKPIKSTVNTVAWHPNNNLLASGCTGYKVRIFSAYVDGNAKEIDGCEWNQNQAITTPLGQLLLEIVNSPNGGGWINHLQFSLDGKRLCWVAQNSSVNVVDVSQSSTPIITRLMTEHLPFLRCLWVSNISILVTGYNYVPMLYRYENEKLEFQAKLDTSQKRSITNITAMRKFQSLDKQARSETSDSCLDSVHQNVITSVQPYLVDSRGIVMKFSTSSLDGQIVIWDLMSLENDIQGLRIS